MNSSPWCLPGRGREEPVTDNILHHLVAHPIGLRIRILCSKKQLALGIGAAESCSTAVASEGVFVRTPKQRPGC